jgi:hypothetical protein
MGKKLKSRKSWREKLENPPEGLPNFFTSPKVVNGPAKWKERFGGSRKFTNAKKTHNNLLASN